MPLATGRLTLTNVSHVLFSLGLIAALGANAIAAPPESAMAHRASQAGALAPALRGRPVMARIHADWCSACKATQPTIDALRAKYGLSVAYVEFDVTDAKTSAAAETKAKQLGLSAFYEANKAVTSTVGIVNPTNGNVVAKFYNDSNADDYTKAIQLVRGQLHAN